MTMALQTTYLSVQPIAYAGQLEGEHHDIITLKNADAVSIPFGTAVSFKTSSPATDKDAILPAPSTGLTVAGIVVHSHAYARTWTDQSGTVHGDLDGTGLVVGTLLNVLRKGKIAVISVQGNVVSDRLWVSTSTTNVSFTQPGQLGNATDTNALDCTRQGEWLSSATAGGFAWLEVDFVNRNS